MIELSIRLDWTADEGDRSEIEFSIFFFFCLWQIATMATSPTATLTCTTHRAMKIRRCGCVSRESCSAIARLLPTSKLKVLRKVRNLVIPSFPSIKDYCFSFHPSLFWFFWTSNFKSFSISWLIGRIRTDPLSRCFRSWTTRRKDRPTRGSYSGKKLKVQIFKKIYITHFDMDYKNKKSCCAM